MENSRLLAGLTKVTLRKHPALIPLLISIGAGTILAATYTLRLATMSPDVSWNKKSNPEPWQKLGHSGQYKMFAVSQNYKDLKPPSDRPDF